MHTAGVHGDQPVRPRHHHFLGLDAKSSAYYTELLRGETIVDRTGLDVVHLVLERIVECIAKWVHGSIGQAPHRIRCGDKCQVEIIHLTLGNAVGSKLADDVSLKGVDLVVFFPLRGSLKR
jgi:hypothetical protein